MRRTTTIQLFLFWILFAASLVSCSEEFSPFEIEGLVKHNEYRNLHGVPPLILSREICDWAKEWAEHLAKEDIFQHRPKNKYGENLHYRWSSNGPSTPSSSKATSSWYGEIKFYDYNNPGYDKKTGHFTALIWKGTLRLGIASAVNNITKKEYIVANYDPGPNVKGAFSTNVPPLLDSFELEAFNLHNYYREKHHAPPLAVNRIMCHLAEEWANHLAEKNILEPSPEKFGQNLFVYESEISAARAAVEHWYKGKDCYDFNNPAYSKEAGFFTSLVWVGVKELGIAKSTNLVSGKTVVVAYYDPPTNIDGKFEANVLPSPSSNIKSSFVFTLVCQIIVLLVLRK